MKVLDNPGGSRSIQIYFRHGPHIFRPVLIGLDGKNPRHMEIAKAIEQRIQSDIVLRQFRLEDYEDRFRINTRMRQVFNLASGRMTFAECLDDFMRDVERTREHATCVSYQKAIDNHLRPQFGHLLLTELTPQMFRSYIRDELGHLGQKAVANILTPARCALEQAVGDRQLDHNPLDGVKLKYLLSKDQRRKVRPPDPFTMDEIREVLAAAQDYSPRFWNLMQFGFFVGPRVSELMALDWPSVDLPGATAHIHQAWVYGKLKDCPKTDAGNRVVNLLPLAVEALQRQRQFTQWQKGRVFCRVNQNAPLETYAHVNRPWRTILKKAGVRYRSPYQMRHTYISHRLSAGDNPLEVASQVGHADPHVMYQFYAEYVEGWKDSEIQFGVSL